jgi:hypothetical protein
VQGKQEKNIKREEINEGCTKGEDGGDPPHVYIEWKHTVSQQK